VDVDDAGVEEAVDERDRPYDVPERVILEVQCELRCQVSARCTVHFSVYIFRYTEYIMNLLMYRELLLSV
jgi:hypothetical protein